MPRPLKHGSKPMRKITITMRPDWVDFIDDKLVPRKYGKQFGPTNRSEVIEALMAEKILDEMDDTIGGNNG